VSTPNSSRSIRWLTICAEPQSKKRKTEQPVEVADDDEPEGEDDEDVEAADLEDDEEEVGADEDADEDADDTAKTSGPTQAAKARKGKVVPKEADLDEVEDDDEE